MTAVSVLQKYLPEGSKLLLLEREDDRSAMRYRPGSVLSSAAVHPPVDSASTGRIAITFDGTTVTRTGRAVRFVLVDPDGFGHISGTVSHAGRGGDLQIRGSLRIPEDPFMDGVWIEEGEQLPGGALVLV